MTHQEMTVEVHRFKALYLDACRHRRAAMARLRDEGWPAWAIADEFGMENRQAVRSVLQKLPS